MNSLLGVLIALLSAVQFTGIDISEGKTLFSFSNDDGPIYVLVYYEDGSEELLYACEFYDVPCQQNNAIELTATLAWADVLDMLLIEGAMPDWLSAYFTLFEDGSFNFTGCIRTLPCGEEWEPDPAPLHNPWAVDL